MTCFYVVSQSADELTTVTTSSAASNNKQRLTSSSSGVSSSVTQHTGMTAPSSSSQQQHHHQTSLLLESLLDHSKEDDENAQSILDGHCNRIGWDRSRGETPTGGTGRHSPDHQANAAAAAAAAAGYLHKSSFHTTQNAANISSMLHNSLNLSNSAVKAQNHALNSSGVTSSHQKSKKEKSIASQSLVSFDSGVVDEHHRQSSSAAAASHSRSFTCGMSAHHYLPVAGAAGRQYQPPPTQQQQQVQNVVLFEDISRGVKDTPSSSSAARHARRSVDNVTVADSGFNEFVVPPAPPAASQQRIPNPHDPAHNK